ncbi:DUF222 domain-containing protein [Microbacterium fluvii]|uniref:DUF222 domain-containing protein n=1 Tax=Microbacterium fluvii TaxID=415215 RepID=A0ABW2HE68_9MICO|nr:HNH endonuclease signature motif containing protein [Microbacterium fluvii]MCU4673134.1 HNH endonuclease [Microbacterium fluvii]
MTSSSEPTPSPGFSDAEARLLDELTTRFVEARRAKAAAEAAESVALSEAMNLVTVRRARVASADSRTTDLPLREIAAELACAVRASDRTIQARLAEAAMLADDFPDTLTALAGGQIERGHIVAILDTGSRIGDPKARAEFEQKALGICRRETPGRARPLLRMLAQRIDPIPLQERHDLARRDRDVRLRDGDDGMSELWSLQPTVIAHGIFDRLTQQAKAVIEARKTDAAGTATLEGFDDLEGASGEGAEGGPANATPEPALRDTRTLSEVRADVLADLLLTGHATAGVSAASVPEARAIHARVQITAPAATLTGDGDEPAELIGHGPIDPDTARRLAGHAHVWMRLFTDHGTGCVRAVDQYRPPASLRRLLAARDEHCRFPGCRQPVWRCDLDHTFAHVEGGRTEACNLAHLCEGHHVLKHHTAWKVRQLPGGVLEWTSPTGRVYPDTPARTLMFTTVQGADAPPGDPPDPPPPF